MKHKVQEIFTLAERMAKGELAESQARKELQRAIAGNREQFFRDLPIITMGLNHPLLGDALAHLGLAAAKTLAREDVRYACTTHITDSLIKRKEYDHAILLLKENIAFLSRDRCRDGMSTVRLSDELLNLANLLNELDYQEEALKTCVQGVRYLEQVPPEVRREIGVFPYEFGLASAYNVAGCLAKDNDELKQSLGYFYKSQKRIQRLPTEHTKEVAVLELRSGLVNNFGLLYRKLLRLVENGTRPAEEPILEKLLEASELGVNASTEDIVTLLEERIRKCFEAALRLIKLTPNKVYYCNQLHSLGNLLERSEPDAALEYFRAVKNVAAAHGYQEKVIDAGADIAAVYRKIGRKRDAYAEATSVLENIEEIYRVQLGLGVSNKVLYRFVYAYILAIECSLDLSYLDKAIGFMERIKARVLQKQMVTKLFLLPSYRGMRKKFGGKTSFEHTMSLLPGRGKEPVSLYFDDDGVRKARRMLGGGRRLLIEMFSAEKDLICILIGSRDLGSGREVAVIRVASFDRTVMGAICEDLWIQGRVEGLRSSLEAQQPHRHAVALEVTRSDDQADPVEAVARKLRETLWAFLEKKVHELDPAHLVLVPHLGLHFLPFHLIPVVGGKRLLDRYRISYAPSLASLKICRMVGKEVELKSTALILSDPEKGHPRWGLEFAEVEGRRVAEEFDSVCLLEGADATRAALCDDMQKYSVIHLACHGHFSREVTTESFIQLADGPLSLQDMGGEFLLATGSVAVLSACESGIVELCPVDEFIGLPHAFLAAGCSTVISSLWPVDDFATTLLMDHFYRNWRQLDMERPEALRKAQHWVRRATNREIQEHLATAGSPVLRRLRWRSDQADVRPFSHPYYWAAFICYGDWEC